ncbi:hypothetical protein C4B63_39g141 [Trypanosoma cruzi]|uniref:Uncharacterized protein n=1 Tax=Trypanosoma cruzi TaxID=5693 RepID=A0A2V2VD57_TRYCR|nr:hypothetical protein C4B63_39g141 [Trypanosoma cruzi]
MLWGSASAAVGCPARFCFGCFGSQGEQVQVVSRSERWRHCHEQLCGVLWTCGGGEWRRGRNWWQQSACLFFQGMETRGAETTSLPPTTIQRSVRAMEGATDMPVACTPRVTEGLRLVDDRFSTKMPEERCTPGVFETTGLRPIDDVGSDAVLQWRFFFCLLATLFLPWRS